MTPEDQARFGAVSATLKDGRTASIRPLTTADAAALWAFYAGMPHITRRHYPVPTEEAKAIERAAEADSPLHVTLVLEMPGGRIGGYAWYRWEKPESEQSTFGLCIAVDCQEQRAGRLLMTRLLEIAREVGPPVMNLTVQLANIRAVKLYTSMGFQVVREQICKRPEGSEFADEPEYYMERPVR
jgi:ribosomal protein S18 acetylase RimI-like enzyme